MKPRKPSGRPPAKSRGFKSSGYKSKDFKPKDRDFSPRGRRPHRDAPSFPDEPGTILVEIRAITEDGDALASPIEMHGNEPQDILIPLDKDTRTPPAAGDRVLVRLLGQEGETAVAQLVRILPPARTESVIGVFRIKDGKNLIESTDKRGEAFFKVADKDRNGAEPGELVRAEAQQTTRRNRIGAPEAKIIERIGASDAPKAVSLIAIHAHDIPNAFPQEVEAEAESAPPPVPGKGRVDLRHLPLVTIDGEDARDFDDAVFAERDNMGWHLVVAIADVAHYVLPGSPLDREAYLRGNSVYFPDRVVPMLPEALSNGLCSLKPKEDRYCLAMHLWLDPEGVLKRYRLDRAIMRSAARLTYTQVQQAHDGKGDATTAPLMKDVIRPLYAAYRLLHKQRWTRGALDIELPEYYVMLDDKGGVKDIYPRDRHDSHKLIEEMMILANVAAAKLLHSNKIPTLYRVHEQPEEGKIYELADFLSQLGQKLHAQDGITALKFNELFHRVKTLPIAQVVHMAALRAQMQAYYGPERMGHFGLALTDYAHFTSPIRRYSDLIVHRGLIKAHKLGDDGLTDAEAKRVGEIGEHISFTERRAMMAERESRERYTVSFLQNQVGSETFGIISGVARTGLFVALERTGADGYIPLQALAQDYFVVDERKKLVRGRRTGITLRLGDRVRVRIDEANALTGRLRLTLVELPVSAKPYPRDKDQGDRPERHFDKDRPAFKDKRSSFRERREGRGMETREERSAPKEGGRKEGGRPWEAPGRNWRRSGEVSAEKPARAEGEFKPRGDKPFHKDRPRKDGAGGRWSPERSEKRDDSAEPKPRRHWKKPGEEGDAKPFRKEGGFKPRGARSEHKEGPERKDRPEWKKGPGGAPKREGGKPERKGDGFKGGSFKGGGFSSKPGKPGRSGKPRGR